MTELGRLLVLIGLIIVVAGLLLWGLGRVGFRGLPGDIRYESDHVRFYFPIVTSLVLSAVLTLIFWIVRWLGRK